MFKTDMANFRLGKEKIKNDKKIIAAQKALTAEQKKQASLKKSGTVFDLEQIGLVAALKGKLSEEEKIRIEAQLALLNGNEVVAKKLTDQIINAQAGGKELAAFLTSLPNANNPFKYWDSYLEAIEARIRALNLVPGGGTPSPSPSGNVPKMPIASPDLVLAQANADFANANNQIRIIVEGGDEVTSLMRYKIQEAAQSGSTTNWSQTVGAWDR
jgi:hypothetical protein